jgi:hypothetical protein
LPFLIGNVHTALAVAGVVVTIELFAIAWVRWRFFKVPARLSLFYIAVAGVVALAIGVGLGSS